MYTYDTSTMPLFVIEITGELTADDLVTMERGIDYGIARQAPYVTLTLARTVKPPSAPVRARIAELVTKNKANRACVADAVVVGNRLIQGAMTAIRWVTPAPRPEASFVDVDGAMRWLAEQAQQHGFTLPESARARATQTA